MLIYKVYFQAGQDSEFMRLIRGKDYETVIKNSEDYAKNNSLKIVGIDMQPLKLFKFKEDEKLI